MKRTIAYVIAAAAAVAILVCGYWFFGTHQDQIWGALGLVACNAVVLLPVLGRLGALR